MKTSAGIFILYGDKVLVGHPTNQSKLSRSIPKGGLEVNETEIEAAIRETYEESNILFKETDLEDVPLYFKYDNKNKRLKTFIVNIDKKPDDIKCTSTFVKNGKEYPEMDYFEQISLNKIMKYELSSGIKKAFEQLLWYKNIKV